MTAATAGTIVPAGGESETRIRTGLLPAFAVFDAKGKEGAPTSASTSASPPRSSAAAGVHDCFGAQIDMRQVYLTVGGALGPDPRRPRDRPLRAAEHPDRPDPVRRRRHRCAGTPARRRRHHPRPHRLRLQLSKFKAQMTYSTAPGRPFQLSVGLFEPATNGPYTKTQLPRVEAEGVWTGGQHQGLGRRTGAEQQERRSTTRAPSAFGASGGVRFGSSTLLADRLRLLRQGHRHHADVQRWHLHRRHLRRQRQRRPPEVLRLHRPGHLHPGQQQGHPGRQLGLSILKASDTEGGDGKTENTLVSGGIYFQATKSLKVVGEFNYAVDQGRRGRDRGQHLHRAGVRPDAVLLEHARGTAALRRPPHGGRRCFCPPRATDVDSTPIHPPLRKAVSRCPRCPPSSARPSCLGLLVMGCAGGVRTHQHRGHQPRARAGRVRVRPQTQLKGVGLRSDVVRRGRACASPPESSTRRSGGPTCSSAAWSTGSRSRSRPAPASAVTSIKIEAKTFAEYTTQRGPTEEQEQDLGDGPRRGADASCRSAARPVDSTSVPG